MRIDGVQHRVLLILAIGVACTLFGCASDEENALVSMRKTAAENFKVSSQKCQDAMTPVWAQLNSLDATEKEIADVTPDQVARLTLPCQKSVFSDACVDAEGTLAERLDKFYGTSNGATVLVNCTRATNDWKTAMDLLSIR